MSTFSDIIQSRLTLDQIDLSTLAPPSAVEAIDDPTLFSAWLAKFNALDEAYTVLLESDPAIKLLEVGAYREMILRQRINDALKALLLPTSYGSNLDALGARFGVARLTVTPVDNTTRPVTPAVMEEDDDFRYRIGLAPDAWSTAGPEGAYEYYALTADANVSSVRVYSYPVVNPGSVLIIVLTRDDSTLAAAVKNVYNQFQRKDITPMTDNVSVRGAIAVPFDIAADLHIGQGPDPVLVKSAAQTALNKYLVKRRRINKRVAITGIGGSLNVASVDYVELGGPAADIVPDIFSYAEVSSTSLNIVIGS